MERKGVKRLAWTLAPVVIAAGLAAGPALAYILPAEAILGGVARRRSDIAFTTIIAEGAYRKGDGPEARVWEAIRANKAHRIERKDPTGVTEVQLTSGGKRWSFKTGERATPERAPGDVLFALMGSTEKDPGGQRGVALLRSLGIDDGVVSLARLDKRVAYVIGAKPWEPEKPQLWVDKELYTPLRLIQVDKKSGSITDTRFLGVGSATSGEWYPERVEVWRDGRLVETTVYSNVRLNEDVSEDLFRPPT